MPQRGEFRNPANYYLALASELVSPALRVTSSVLTGPPTAKETWRKGIIISHTHIGDVLYRTPSLPALAAAFPHCSWDYLVSKTSAPVLGGNPSIASVLPLVSGENSWDLEAGAYSRLRTNSYDVALCTNSLRHYPDLALAVGLGIPNRVAYADRGLSGLITHPVTITRPQPFPAYFREMVRQLGKPSADWSLQPHLAITAGHEGQANAFLGDFADGNGALVACCPTTRQPKGSWPEHFFIDAVNLCVEKRAIRVLVCGAASERARLERVAEAISAPTLVMAGELDLLAFAALLAKCSVAITQDSAARHLANAVRTPVLFFRNHSVNAIETGAYCDSEEDLSPPDQLVADADLATVQARVSARVVADKISERITR